MTARISARSRELEWRRVGEEVVILDLQTQRYFSLNHSGARLWTLLTAGTSRRQLIEELVAAYQIDEAAAGRDVEILIAAG